MKRANEKMDTLDQLGFREGHCEEPSFFLTLQNETNNLLYRSSVKLFFRKTGVDSYSVGI